MIAGIEISSCTLRFKYLFSRQPGGGSKVFLNVGNNLPIDMASHPGKRANICERYVCLMDSIVQLTEEKSRQGDLEEKTLKESDHLEDLSLDGRIILKYILKK